MDFAVGVSSFCQDLVSFFDQFCFTTVIISFLITLISLFLQADEFGEDGQLVGGATSESESDEEDTFLEKPRSSSQKPKSRDSRERSRSHSRSSSTSRRKKSRSQPQDYDSDGSSRTGVLSEKATNHRQNRRIEASYDEMAKTRQSNKAQTAAEKQIARLQAQLAEKEKENQEQQLQLQARSNSSKKPLKRMKGSTYVAKIPVNKDLEARILEYSGHKGPNLWRTTKFLNGEEDLLKATAQIMRDIPECRKFLEEEDVHVKADNIAAFRETYGHAICKGVNDGKITRKQALKTPTLTGTITSCQFLTPSNFFLSYTAKIWSYPRSQRNPTATILRTRSNIRRQ